MKIFDNTFDNIIGNLIVKEDKEREIHIPSGKLSASMLGYPLQWQMLKTLGVPQKPIDEYTLRKFARGIQVENWAVSKLQKVIVDKQKKVEYRNTSGIVDMLILHGSQVPILNKKIIPHEVKSVTNLKFKRIIKNGEADDQYKLQAGLYALALKSEYYAVDIIATDDLRLITYIYETKDIKPDIDAIIDQFNSAMIKKAVPVFTPRYDWQSNPMYNSYPDWALLTEIEIKEKLNRRQTELVFSK
jgi:hypothetical protein